MTGATVGSEPGSVAGGEFGGSVSMEPATIVDVVLVVTTVEAGAFVGVVDTDSRSESSNALRSSEAEPQPATTTSAHTETRATRRTETDFIGSE